MKNPRDVVEEYAEQVLDGMDWKDLYNFALAVFLERLDYYTDEELRQEILDCAPELLEDDNGTDQEAES